MPNLKDKCIFLIAETCANKICQISLVKVFSTIKYLFYTSKNKKKIENYEITV